MIFKHKTYLSFIKERIGKAGSRTGLKGQFAKAINCQQTYLSKILKGDAHLNLEQAQKAGAFFGLSPDEEIYFVLLVSLARAGTPELKKLYKTQLNKILQEKNSVEEYTQISEHLTKEQQQVYYGYWYYAAIHVATSVKKINSIDDLVESLGIDRKRIAEIVSFLIECGLVVHKNGKLSYGPQHIHLKKHSPENLRNHTNWRLQALKKLDHNSDKNFHYTSVTSLSHKDASVLKTRMVEWVADFLKTIEPSEEETMYCHNIDFFQVMEN